MTSYFSSLLWGTSQLDDAVDKATSELLPSGSEDIALNLEICDQIRSKSVPPKDAMRALKRRLGHKNPNVQLLSLSLTDICVKNGGDAFLTEIASREFIDNLVSILKMPALNHDVKNKILRYVQDWATAFEGKPSLSYVGEVYRTLQREGFNFPPRDPAVTASAMVDTQTAPEWIDSDVCLRCRTPFTFTNRKHHCRNCGQVFDQQCSSKSMPLPHFGIMQEVRVCDTCYNKLHKKAHKTHRSSQSVSASRHRSARDLYDAELQRAIQLSLDEVGAAGGRRPGYVPSPSPWQSSEPPLVDRATRPHASSPNSYEEEDDPDLKAAIEASLREASAPKPSAPIVIDASERYMAEQRAGPGYTQSYPPASTTPKPRLPTIPSYDLEVLETDAILTFNQTVDQVQASGGRDLSRYPAVTELFDKANGLRPKLAMSLSDTSRKEEMLVDMHEKLSQAVKLYDKLLTEQLSRPQWRPAGPSAVPVQQSPSGYSQYQPVNGTYSQWQPTPSTPAPAQSYLPPTPSAPVSQPAGAYATSPITEHPPQQMYQPVTPSTAPTFTPNSPVTQPRYGQEGRPYAAVSPPPPVSIPQYGVPPTPVTYQAIPQPPVAVATPAPPPPAPTFSQPQVVPQAPFAQQQQPQQPQGSTLARHNTVSGYRAPMAPAQRPAAAAAVHVNGLARSNTIAASSHAPAQLQHLQQMSVPLPSFPEVPSMPPQAQGYYPPEPERKEALLIDL